MKYSWDDIQNYVSSLPTERIIPVYAGEKKQEIQERYMIALCDRDEQGVLDGLAQAEQEFEARKKKYKEKMKK